MKETPQSLQQQIEDCIQKRQSYRAKQLIQAYLKAERNPKVARLNASEYYRRLSDYHAALAVLGEEVRGEIEINFQIARMLNLLGASRYALRILSGLPRAELTKNRGATLGILLSNYQYESAQAFVSSLEFSESLSYGERLSLVSKIDVLSGLSAFAEADELTEKLIRVSREPILLGILQQIKGANRMLCEDFTAADRAFTAAESFFPEGDASIDRGYLHRWRGGYFVEKNDFENAKKSLKLAWTTLYRKGYKPETWLEILYWQGLMVWKSKKRFPEEWKRIIAYPQVPGSRFLKWIQTHAEIPQQMILFEAGSGAGKHANHLDLEFRLRPRGDFVQYGLNLTEELIGQLILAGPYGIPQFRICEQLWEDELFSYRGNMKRLEQVVIRARNEETFYIAWSDLHLTVEKNAAWSAQWAAQLQVTGVSFLSGKTHFTRKEIENYFQVSPRKALQICSEWQQKNLIKAEGSSKNLHYRVI